MSYITEIEFCSLENDNINDDQFGVFFFLVLFANCYTVHEKKTFEKKLISKLRNYHCVVFVRF